MRHRPRLILFALVLAVAGCLDGAAPNAKPTQPTASLWSAAASQVEAGEWSKSQQLVKDLNLVARNTKTPFPPDYDEFFKPLITKDSPVTGDTKKNIADQLRKWGGK